MPTSIDDTATGAEGFLFPDDLEGQAFTVLEDAVYTAFEVRESEYEEPIEEDYEAANEGQVPAFGRWLIVDVPGLDDPQWMIAPGELIEELQTYDDPTGARLRVASLRKSGPDESDPYEVNVAPAPES